MAMRAVLADGELPARQRLREVLHEIGDVEVLGECASVHETIQLAKLTDPDLLFLDICMRDRDGVGMLDAVSAIPRVKRPQLVFVTASDRFAVRAFEIHAADYVLKPYTVERLRAAVRRVRERQASGSRENGGRALNGARSASRGIGQKPTEKYASRLVFKSRGRIVFVPINEIRWIAAEENYVRICTASETHLLRETMGRLEDRLDPRLFLRVHRSAMVNLQCVREVKDEPDGETAVVLKSGERIPMSRSYRTRLRQSLKH
ncbi:MAG TPA: LytTR family DNA-binding domain-containing protein [Acidobacteriaceae bacterium]|nr:LytTR family DNA-binding domain-containing protein [Acidobacteriaceae bacterium]